jgi:hypothetical protein
MTTRVNVRWVISRRCNVSDQRVAKGKVTMSKEDDRRSVSTSGNASQRFQRNSFSNVQAGGIFAGVVRGTLGFTGHER